MPINKDREYRNMVLSAIQDETPDTEEKRMIVTGYATIFEEPYTLYQNDDLVYDEVVDRNAFENTDMSDVILQFDHEGRVFARMSNNTLSVRPDERGLLIEADLGGTASGRELYEEIEKGYTNKMSFGFTIDGKEESRNTLPDGRYHYLRRITSVRKLYDVSAVSIPANDATSISVRTLTDGVIEQIRAERLEAEKLELRRKKMLLQAKLNGGQ